MLVDRLRIDGDAVLALVAIEDGSVVGHVMFSRLTAGFRGLGLGPVAVAELYRRRGIAGALIEQGLRHAREQGWEMVFLLGDTQFYRRFGFDVSLASGFSSPYAGPHLMALSFSRIPPARSGVVDYAPGFAALS